MLRHTILIPLVFSAARIFAAEQPDTLLLATDVDVVLTETANALHITATNATDTVSFTEQYPEGATIKAESRRSFGSISGLGGNRCIQAELISGNLMFGFVGAPGAPSALDLEMGRSYEISWLNTLGISAHLKGINASVSVGVGLSWRNYRTTTGMRFTPPAEGPAGFEPFNPEVTPKYSRLKVFSLSFPILYKQNFRIPGLPSMAVQAGPVLNWNSHASIASRYIDADGVKHNESTNNTGVRRFSVDLYAAVRLFDEVGIYVRYSPQSVLSNNPALDFRTLSTGVVIGL